MKERIGFLIAGVQKCETGPLHNLLAQHPASTMSCMKEVHFFEKHQFPASQAAYQAYHQDGWGIDDEVLDERMLYGESTPKYTLHGPSGRSEFMERIVAYSAAIKLIVLFRDPVGRAYSQWDIYRRNRGVVPTFNKLIEGLLREPQQLTKYGNILHGDQYGCVVGNPSAAFESADLSFHKTENLNAEMETVEWFLRMEHCEYKPRYTYAADYEFDIDPSIAGHFWKCCSTDMNIFAELSGIDISDWGS